MHICPQVIAKIREEEEGKGIGELKRRKKRKKKKKCPLSSAQILLSEHSINHKQRSRDTLVACARASAAATLLAFQLFN